MKDPEFNNVVVGAFSSFSFDGPPDFYLVKKLKHVKKVIKSWAVEKKRNVGESFDSTLAELSILEDILELRPLEEEEEWTRAECYKNLLEMEVQKTKDSFQKSREWSPENARAITRFLRCFNILSGLKIKLGKSVLYGIGISDAEINESVAILNCNNDSLPFHYLGLQVGANMNRVRNWQVVVNFFDKRLTDWKARSLS
ncbi:hypothetical protein QVD17_30894 [Tagetes erecta]|uniref:Uncharacterized protein n=1 Tax=Tagetes erecta TaxID=13708 RepID=A0AAD8K3D9_TARER|nr:hypothetical protein QVD17_30894 [Tagetes erecta]